MPRTRLVARASLSGVAVLATLTGCTGDAGPTASSATSTGPASAEPVDQRPGNAADPEVDQVVPEADAPTADPGVVLTYAGYLADGHLVEVSALVSGVVEDGGTCTVTATQGGTSVDASTEGTAGASSTECGALDVALPEGASGSWQVQVAYESPGTSGASRTETVTVP